MVQPGIVEHNKLRVLQVINSLGIGGAEMLLYHVTREIVNRGVAEIAVCTLYGKGNLGEKLSSEGIPVYDLSLRRKYSWEAVRRLIRLCRSERFDIIHAHLFPSGYYAALASPFLKTPKLLYTEHSIFNRRRRYPLLRPVESGVYRRFDKIIAVGNVVKDELGRWLPDTGEKTIVLPNAIPVESCGGNETRDIDILFVGRLTHVKGVDVLLKALRMSNKAYRTFIVGDGPERKTLEGLARDLGLEERVSFTGGRSDVRDFMCRARVFVLPSRWEGIPMALLEAMGLGLPVIVTAVGGNREVVDDGTDGLLVMPDNESQLSSALVRLLEDGLLRKKLGGEARRKIRERYSIKNYADTLLRLYHGIIEPKTKGR